MLADLKAFKSTLILFHLRKITPQNTLKTCICVSIDILVKVFQFGMFCFSGLKLSYYKQILLWPLMF